MLNNIKLLLGLTDTSKDALITLLISLVEDDIRNYIHDDNLCGLQNIIMQMVIFKYNQLGSEGVDIENYSGVAFHYSTNYPDSIISQLKRKRKVGVIND